jgi:hypothetical protein
MMHHHSSDGKKAIADNFAFRQKNENLATVRLMTPFNV